MLGIWDELLRDSASLGSSSAALEGRSLLVLGDRYCGKTSLLSKLKGEDLHQSCKGLALDYTFVDVGEDDDVLTRLNVWQLEGEEHHKELLKFSLNAKNLHKSAVVIALDYSKPWLLEESLTRWLRVVADHVKNLQMLPSKMDLLKAKTQQRFQAYKEPEAGAKKKAMSISLHGPEATETPADASDEGTAELPILGEGVLDINLGIPIVVVCCKVDSMATLVRSFGLKDGHFDYIQQHLRRLCLTYGASLVYTSYRNDVNCDVLLEYLEHLLYGFDFVHQPQLQERDMIFVPIGWDSPEKVTLDFESQRVCTDVNTPFEEVVKKPASIVQQEEAADALISAEDDQEFLQRHKDTLEKKDLIKAKGKKTSEPAAQFAAVIEGAKAAGSVPSSPSKPVGPASSPASSPSSAGGAASPGKDAAMERDQISSFFTNLLKKGK